MKLIKILIVCLLLRSLSAASTKEPLQEKPASKKEVTEDEGRDAESTRKAHF